MGLSVQVVARLHDEEDAECLSPEAVALFDQGAGVLVYGWGSERHPDCLVVCRDEAVERIIAPAMRQCDVCRRRTPDPHEGPMGPWPIEGHPTLISCGTPKEVLEAITTALGA